MLRKIGLLLSVAACGAMVTSCGGDDTPTPTPTETVTPTPTPTTSTTFSLTADFAATSFNANYGYAFFTPATGGAEVFSGGARLNGTSSITFTASPDSATFVFPDLDDPVVFGASNFVSVSSTQRQYASGDTALSLFLPFTNVMRVTYEIDNQDFTLDTVAGTLRSQRVALYFNSVTTTDDITAALSYTGAVDVTGGDPGETAAGAVSSPDVTVTITPGTTDTLTGTINLFETVNGVQTPIGTFAISATVPASGVFQGTITDTANDLTGSYVGTLAGPNREEIFVLFAAQDANVAGAADDGDNRVYVGSFIGD